MVLIGVWQKRFQAELEINALIDLEATHKICTSDLWYLCTDTHRQESVFSSGRKTFECSAAVKQVTKERNNSIPNCKKIRLRRLTRSLQLMEL